MIRFVRDTTAFALMQGIYEGLRYGTSAGRTHATSWKWNEAYDTGLNIADWVRS